MPLNALYGYYVFDHIGEVRVQVVRLLLAGIQEACVPGRTVTQKHLPLLLYTITIITV